MSSIPTAADNPGGSSPANLAPVQPCLWFDGQAREAMEYYVSIFPNSRIVEITEYPDESLNPHFEGMSGKVLNGQFNLNGVDFVCLDGGPYFTGGFSWWKHVVRSVHRTPRSTCFHRMNPPSPVLTPAVPVGE